MASGVVVSVNERAKTLSGSRVARLELLISVAENVTSILDLDRLLKEVGTLIKEVIPYEHFAIFLYDEERRELIWKFGVGYTEDSRRNLERFSINRGLVGRAVRTRSSVVSVDVSHEPDFLAAETASGEALQSALAIPLIHQKRTVGAMTLESVRLAEFNEEQEQILSPLGSILAIAIDNANLYQTSIRDAATKELLFEASREMSSILDLQLLLDKIADMLLKVIDYQLFAIFLLDPHSGDLILKNTRGWSAEVIRHYSRVKKGEGLFWKAIQDKCPTITVDTSKNPDYLPKRTVDGQRLNSQINVPLLAKDRPVGVMSLEGDRNCCVDPEHERILSTLANQIAVNIENAQLYEELVSRERKLDSDLQIAKELQLAMLPNVPPKITGYEVGCIYMPADNLGGDFYDFFRLPSRRRPPMSSFDAAIDASFTDVSLQLPPNRRGLVIADVSGKGVAAAMTMAASRGAVRSAALDEDQPSAVLQRTNRRLYLDIKRNVYITLCYGVLDPASGSFTYASAGHFPPLLMRANGKASFLEEGGTILGMFDKEEFAQETVELDRGDLICFYTDGIVEAFNEKDESYGEDRLENQLRTTRQLSATEMAHRVVASVEEFARGTDQHDDMTIIVLKSV